MNFINYQLKYVISLLIIYFLDKFVVLTKSIFEKIIINVFKNLILKRGVLVFSFSSLDKNRGLLDS